MSQTPRRAASQGDDDPGFLTVFVGLFFGVIVFLIWSM